MGVAPIQPPPASPTITGQATASPIAQPRAAYIFCLVLLNIILFTVLASLALKLTRARREAQNIADLIELKEVAENANKQTQEMERRKRGGIRTGNEAEDEAKFMQDRFQSGSVGWKDWTSPKKGT